MDGIDALWRLGNKMDWEKRIRTSDAGMTSPEEAEVMIKSAREGGEMPELPKAPLLVPSPAGDCEGT